MLNLHCERSRFNVRILRIPCSSPAATYHLPLEGLSAQNNLVALLQSLC